MSYFEQDIGLLSGEPDECITLDEMQIHSHD